MEGLGSKFKAAYTFQGDYGIVECDVRGQRKPAGERGAADNDYTEFHSFDVDIMKRIGIRPGKHDILFACGWSDEGRSTMTLKWPNRQSTET